MHLSANKNQALIQSNGVCTMNTFIVYNNEQINFNCVGAEGCPADIRATDSAGIKL